MDVMPTKELDSEDKDFDLDDEAFDSVISGCATEPSTPFNASTTTPTTVSATHERSNARHQIGKCLPLHTEAVECGGLNMAQLKAAMTSEAAAQEPLVVIIGTLLNMTVQRNDALRRVSTLYDFETRSAFSLTASDYLSRIISYGQCSASCSAVSLIYLQRLKTKIPSTCVTSFNLQRLLLIAVMLANKYLDDYNYPNRHWANIGGITLREINHLELIILRHLDWNLNVSREEYLAYLKELGCGPQDDSTDSAMWAEDLHKLKFLVKNGIGVRLCSEPAAAVHCERTCASSASTEIAPVCLDAPVPINTASTYAVNSFSSVSIDLGQARDGQREEKKCSMMVGLGAECSHEAYVGRQTSRAEEVGLSTLVDSLEEINSLPPGLWECQVSKVFCDLYSGLQQQQRTQARPHTALTYRYI